MKKKKVNFFCVSDGASETSNDGTNKCVEFHFQKQKEWEETMFEKETEEIFRKNFPQYCSGEELLSPYWDLFESGINFGREKMREFTPEEKELIVNTPITVDSFEFNKHLPMPYSYINDESETELDNVYYHIAWSCEHLRQNFLETKDPEFEEQLLRLLPNSYKVVNLCATKKDLCKEKQNNQNNFNKRR